MAILKTVSRLRWIARSAFDEKERMAFVVGDVLDVTDEIRRLHDTLREIRDLFEDKVDADHNGHCFIPNDAARAVQLVDEALREAGQ